MKPPLERNPTRNSKWLSEYLKSELTVHKNVFKGSYVVNASRCIIPNVDTRIVCFQSCSCQEHITSEISEHISSKLSQHITCTLI
jgi:hypothetical protein